MSLLITPTLLNSFDWLQKCPPSWKDRAYKDLMGTLNREPWKPNRAVRMGMEFEKKVYANANKANLDELKASQKFIQVCKRVKGFDYQKSTKLFIEVDGEEYCCFGRIDCYSSPEIIDIKTTGKYGGRGKYLSGWQHKFYTALEGVEDFVYLIAEWKDPDKEDYAIKEVYEVPYHVATEDMPQVVDEIKDHIRTFIDYVNFDDGMKEAYYTVYSRYNKK